MIKKIKEFFRELSMCLRSMPMCEADIPRARHSFERSIANEKLGRSKDQKEN